MWGPRFLTRLSLPFQMKAERERERETVLFGPAAEPCLQTAGMWDVWSGGQEARKECQACPCLSRAGSPFSPLVTRREGASGYKGSRAPQSQLRSAPLPKLSSSFNPRREERLQTRSGRETPPDKRSTRSETLRLQGYLLNQT